MATDRRALLHSEASGCRSAARLARKKTPAALVTCSRQGRQKRSGESDLPITRDLCTGYCAVATAAIATPKMNSDPVMAMSATIRIVRTRGDGFLTSAIGRISCGTIGL